MSDHIILSEPVLEELNNALSIIDLNNFRQANNLDELPINIIIKDLDNQITQINYLGEGIVDLVEQLEEYGSENLLNLAILEKNLPLVELLIQLGADPNRKVELEGLKHRYQNLKFSYSTMFPLLAAVEAKDPEILKYLIDNKADPNSMVDNPNTMVDGINYTMTILTLAVRIKNLEVIEILLKSGADPNIVDSFDGTSLSMAITDNLPEIARLLVRYGANPYFVDSDGQSILDITDLDIKEMVELMLEFGYTPEQIDVRKQEMIEQELKFEQERLERERDTEAFLERGYSVFGNQ